MSEADRPLQAFERERESLTYWIKSIHEDNFSLFSYIYVKRPEPDSDKFCRLFTLAAYTFTYPSSRRLVYFIQIFQRVITEENFLKNFDFFSSARPIPPTTELPLTMPATWSAGVFFIYPPETSTHSPSARAPPCPQHNDTAQQRNSCGDGHGFNELHHQLTLLKGSRLEGRKTALKNKRAAERQLNG